MGDDPIYEGMIGEQHGSSLQIQEPVQLTWLTDETGLNDVQEYIHQKANEYLWRLLRKSEQYASDRDPLVNFRDASRFQKITNLAAARGMLTKHLVRFNGLIGQDEYDPVDADTWDEVIGDIVNYMFLIRAIAKETERTNNDTQSD